MAKHKIPEAVLKEAEELIKLEKGGIRFIGKSYQYGEVFRFVANQNLCTGFPFVYLYKNNKVTKITGIKALHISSLFIKD